MNSRLFVAAALAGLGFASTEARSESEGNGNPFPFQSSILPVSVTFVTSLSDTGSSQYPAFNLDLSVPASVQATLPQNGQNGPVQTANSLPRDSMVGTLAFRQEEIRNSWFADQEKRRFARQVPSAAPADGLPIARTAVANPQPDAFRPVGHRRPQHRHFSHVQSARDHNRAASAANNHIPHAGTVGWHHVHHHGPHRHSAHAALQYNPHPAALRQHTNGFTETKASQLSPQPPWAVLNHNIAEPQAVAAGKTSDLAQATVHGAATSHAAHRLTLARFHTKSASAAHIHFQQASTDGWDHFQRHNQPFHAALQFNSHPAAIQSQMVDHG